MAFSVYLKKFIFTAMVMVCISASLEASADTNRESVYGDEAGISRVSGEAVDLSLEKAERDIQGQDFTKARERLEKILSQDNSNVKARKLLAKLDQTEAIARANKPEKAPSFFAGIFSFGKKPVLDAPKEIKEDNTNKISEYIDRSREDLASENFSSARNNAVKAANLSGGSPDTRKLLSDIDTAEGIFREKNNIPSGADGSSRARSAEDYIKERNRYEARKKKEDLEIRENIMKARELLKKGSYEKAREAAYKVWKKIPYDTEVSILIADINKAILVGTEGLKTDLSESEDLIEPYVPPKEDPMLKYPDTDGFGDIVVSLAKGVKDLFASEKFDMEYEYPSLEYSLDDCVEVALISSQRMKFAEEQVKLGETRIWELRRKLFPDLALKMERSSGKIADSSGAPGEGATRHYQGEKYMAEVRHTVFNGFGTYYEVRQAQSNLEIIKMEKERIHNDIVEETKKAYYNLDKTVKALRIQEKISSRIEEIHEIAKKAYEKGFLSAVEYLKVKGLNMQAEFQTISSTRDRELAHMVLVQAMNADPDRTVKVKELEIPAELLKIGLQNCYNLALANNPDLKIKEKTIEYYNFEREISKAKGWPKVDFTGNFGKANENYQPMRSDSDWGGADHAVKATKDLAPEWYVGIKGSVPLGGNTFEYNYVREIWAPTVSAFRGTESATSYFTFRLLDDLAYFTGVQESKVGFERSKYEYQKAKNDLAMQVKTAYFKYRKALLQMDVATAQVEHQKMFVAVLEERRKYGEMNLSQLVEEYVKLGEHEYGEIAGDTEYYVSVTEINKAVGVMDYFHPWQTIQDDRRQDTSSLIKNYLELAGKELAEERFSSARKLAMKALELDGTNKDARNFLRSIDQAEGLFRENENMSIVK